MSPFDPLFAVARLLDSFDHPWAFCGGWAIDLFLNRVTRPHKDVDVAVRRVDQLALQDFLTARGWRLQVAHDGGLTPWIAGERVELPRHGIWATHPSFRPDFVEILLNEADGTTFRFRRDSSITLPVSDAFLLAPNGLPMLAPEIALLYKAAYPDEPESRHDFDVALQALDSARRAWLGAALQRMYSEHRWQHALAERPF